MRIDVHVYLPADESQLSRLLTLVSSLTGKVNTIMANQTQLAADLQALRNQVAKIGTEITATLQKVTELEAALAAAGGTTPEVDAAVEGLKTQLQAVDDLIADAPPPTP
jgi:chromosome segregation ATPase